MLLTDLHELKTWREQLDGARVVVTNGCFDLLHVGHVRLLQQARQLGSVLVVGINSDESVRALKGPARPVQCLADRMEIVAALRCVTAVVPFHETRAVELLRHAQPDVWVKGGDYTLETLDAGERQVAAGMGCTVHILPLVPGKSTTRLLAPQ